MTSPAHELLSTLANAGARVRLEDGQLWVRAKPGILTPELKQEIQTLKAQLIQILTTYACSRCGWGVYPEPTVCFHCRQASGAGAPPLKSETPRAAHGQVAS